MPDLPRHVRVSPDGANVAYDIFRCGDPGYATFWTPSSSPGLNFPGQTGGQADYLAPAWMDDSHLLLTHAGQTVTADQAAYLVYTLNQPDGSGAKWCTHASDLTGYEIAVSRAADKLAVVENDAADHFDGVAATPTSCCSRATGRRRRSRSSAARSRSPGSASPCTRARPSRPTGPKLAWGDDPGVELADVSNLSDCASVSVRLIVPQGALPFFSKANIVPAASTGGGGTATGGGGGTTTGGGGTTTGGAAGRRPATAPRRRSSPPPSAASRAARAPTGACASVRRPPRAKWAFGDGKRASGRKVSHVFKRRGRYKVVLTLIDASGAKASVRKVAVVRR